MSSIVFSSVDDFNLKFKKQSENLKTLRRRENMQELETRQTGL